CPTSMRRSIRKAAPTGIMSTRMGKARPAQLVCSSPRKRGPKAAGTKELDPRIDIRKDAVLRTAMRGNERETFEAPALYRLMAWLSPAYPVGAFSYSSGI